ncbi:hypothetical protein [Shewanella sp. NFH-SH190041]|nr:hypothetical protein [Shewanella sp. NFH-SH190041]
MSAFNHLQQPAGKSVTQIAAQLCATLAGGCAGRYVPEVVR